MSLNQIIDQDVNGPLVCDETLNLCGNQLRLKSQIIVPEGDFTNVDTVTINNVPYPPGGGFLPAPVPNKILRTNGLSVVSWGDVNPSNLTGGSTGDVLKTVAPGVVAWDPVKANEITPGLANQILHTNTLGTAAEWTSTLIVPSTLTVAGSTVLQSNVNCDQTLSVDQLFSAVSDMTVGGSADFAGDLTFVGNSGTVGQYIQKTGATTQNWADLSVVPGDITPGLIGQVLVSNGLATVWSDDIDLPGLLNVTSGTTLQSTLIVSGAVTNQNSTNCNGLLTTNNGATINGTANIVNNLQFNGSSGTTGQVIKKTGASTQAWSDLASTDIKGGSLNQVMQSDGTNGVFNTNVTLAGDLNVNAIGSITSLLETRLYDKLKLGGNNAGNKGQICVSDASSIPHWENPQYFAQYYQNAPTQNMNGAATVLLMSSASVNVANSNITYLAGVFTVAEDGDYLLTYETRPDTCAASTQVNFRINGVMLGSMINNYIPALAQPSQFILQKTYRLTANSTIEVVSEPLVAGAINTSGSDSNGNATTMLTIQRIGAYI